MSTLENIQGYFDYYEILTITNDNKDGELYILSTGDARRWCSTGLYECIVCSYKNDYRHIIGASIEKIGK